MARRTKEDAEKTRESLLDAAERVFLRRGVAKSTLEEIAREAGLTRGAVYWHFENKIAIFRAMHDRVKLPMDMLFDEVTGGAEPLAGLKTMCLHVFRAVEQDEHVRNVFTIMRLRNEGAYCDEAEYGEEVQAKRRDVHAKFTRVFTQIGQRHAFVEGITPEIAAYALHSFISGVFWDYLNTPDLYPIGDLAPVLVDCFFRGIMRA
jgi:TetR/AcrR family acrAB operon transcriptional repressor/TetR/AcrR family transcriptional repressor of mexAB-oprM operon